MEEARARGGVALAALGGILAITVAWWALALWPAGSAMPEWVLRTRDICFGSRPDGLPDAGGWVLLIGEPIGMMGVLMAVWGDALRADLRALRATFRGQLVLATALVGLLYSGAAVVSRVRTFDAPVEAAVFRASGGARQSSLTRPVVPPPLVLVDQRGGSFALSALRGRRVIVTFAFAHCQTVCPTIVRDLRAARRTAEAADAVIVVVTLDPWRDVPARLPSIAAAWGLDGDDRALSGTVADVTSVLEAWGVPRVRDQQTGEITHAATVVLLDRDGRLRYRLVGDWTQAETLLRTL